MNKIFLGFISLFLSFSIHAAPLAVGATAPDWTANNNKEESIHYYEKTEGKVSVILFWSASCRYCTNLMPYLEVVYRKYRNKGVRFYAISALEDENIDSVKFFKEQKYSYTQILDGDEIAKEYGIIKNPALFVIDKNKNVIYRKPSGVSEILVKQNVDLTIKTALKK